MDAKTPGRAAVYGGLAAAFADALTNPLDVVKVRMQLQGENGAARQYKNAGDAAIQIVRSEGPLALAKGIRPAMLRQMTYGGLRVGLYAPYKELFGAQSSRPAPVRKALAGIATGSTAAFLTSPIDLIKVRMQADGMRSHGPPPYRGVIDAAASIFRQEGLLGFYKGVLPSTLRAGMVAMGEIVSYDEIKTTCLRNGYADDVRLHLGVSIISGFLATLISSPFDVMKARLMSQPFDAHGKGMHYKGLRDCFSKSLRAEGPNFMFRGFVPNYLNKGPTVVVFFLAYEQIKRFGDSYMDGTRCDGGEDSLSPAPHAHTKSCVPHAKGISTIGTVLSI